MKASGLKSPEIFHYNDQLQLLLLFLTSHPDRDALELAGPAPAHRLAHARQLLDPGREVRDPGGHAAGGGHLVPHPAGRDHPLGQGGDQSPVVVGLLLATAGDGHHVLQVLSHGLKQLHSEVDLTLKESEIKDRKKFSK